MSNRIVHPYHAADISALAKAIGRELQKSEDTPGHVDLLNILSRSAGSSLSGKSGIRFSRKDKRQQRKVESVWFNLNLTDSIAIFSIFGLPVPLKSGCRLRLRNRKTSISDWLKRCSAALMIRACCCAGPQKPATSA
ncbi:mevalonate pyrophosphate decarboxylase [Agrobacterium vitis]|nr:mevalonate pyrophosphate decarboxylase [Agrobacterium vitis]MBE1439794.1 mevalonate pyrophosphate decarboxylase [Agrobacterium vitis]